MKILLAAALAVLPCMALAAQPAPLKLWNLTANTLDVVQFAPSGTSHFGPNQCANDKDGNVDFDEQLRLTNLPPGTYDVRLHDRKGRQCLVRNVAVPEKGVISIDEKAMTECGP